MDLESDALTTEPIRHPARPVFREEFRRLYDSPQLWFQLLPLVASTLTSLPNSVWNFTEYEIKGLMASVISLSSRPHVKACHQLVFFFFFSFHFLIESRKQTQKKNKKKKKKKGEKTSRESVVLWGSQIRRGPRRGCGLHFLFIFSLKVEKR